MSKSILDEYIRRRQGGTAVYDPQTSQYGRPGGYAREGVRPQSPARGYMGEKAPVYKPPTVPKPYTPKPQTQQTGAGLDATEPTDSGGSNVLTWDDQIDIEIQNAAKKVLEVANRKFQYSTHESPIYSIMRQEYLKEADLAAGRATAAAAQNAGGFGSSFAVMAGEEARRQVMEGFYDQEDELYAAARSEYEAEQASAFDNYLKLRELLAMEQERIKTERPMTMTLPDGTTVEVTDAARELYAGYLDSFTQGTGYDTLKTAMINGGASEADADQAIAMFKKLGGATVADQISSFELNPTLDTAQEIWDEARRAGKEKEYLPKLSAGVSSMSAKKLDAAKTDEEEAGILLNAKSAFEAGYLTAENYADVYIHAVENDIKKNSGSKKKDKYKNIIKNYGDIVELAEQGQIPPEVADKIADWLINDTNISDNFIERYDNKGNVIGYSVQSATGPFAFTKKEEELLYDMIKHKLTKEKLLGIKK